MSLLSMLLVAAQALLLFALAMSGPLLPRGWPVFPVLAGTLLGLWSVWAMRRSKLRIHPEPHPEAALVQHGPYRWIRHPMYSAVLLVAAGWVFAAPAVWRVLAGCLLVAVLLAKLCREERLWSDRMPAYRDYMKRTKRLIPFLY
ncbi:MAG TPA: isoprenylcysteine carboxylmethyltransferase family protein [Kiritimatiellia bacterium]|nr:isoprenylcysteine carboxylmethyltransferase family protein [Kiritimatiellia bacterium]HMP33025.1 isoprenylcysteine carboxylmethyltransferase family protein [Kiritimatiellia bacterium]